MEILQAEEALSPTRAVLLQIRAAHRRAQATTHHRIHRLQVEHRHREVIHRAPAPVRLADAEAGGATEVAEIALVVTVAEAIGPVVIEKVVTIGVVLAAPAHRTNLYIGTRI